MVDMKRKTKTVYRYPISNEVADGYDKVRAGAPRFLGYVALLSVVFALTLIIGVQVLHEVFTRPEHTINFFEALVVTVPASFALMTVVMVVKGVLRSKDC
jgi:Na+-driven multidrug efflux pump